MNYTNVSAAEFAATPGLDDWRFALGAIHGSFHLDSFPAAASFASSIADVAEEQQHHPDIDIRYPGRVFVRLTTHDSGGLTTQDVKAAKAISRLATAVGATPHPTHCQMLEIAIDTVNAASIVPFWVAVLGYRLGDDGDLTDPTGRGPAVWFQEMTEPRTQRNRIHFDVSVPHDVAEQRVAAALAAGGTLVSDSRARAFWVLADAEGNEVCVCTWQDRS